MIEESDYINPDDAKYDLHGLTVGYAYGILNAKCTSEKT
jgi:hypothetical protein